MPKSTERIAPDVVTIEEIAKHVLQIGDRVVTRDLVTYETMNGYVTFPIGLYPRRKRMAEMLGVIEGLGMISGVYDMDAIKKAAPKADHSLFGSQSAYGPRIKSQLPKVIQHLRKEPATRRAVLILPKPAEAGTPNIPCTSSIQFFIRAGRLHMTVYMRSWDVVFGLPYDIQQFGILGMIVARMTGTTPGNLSVFAGSLHVYEDTRSLAVNADPPHGVMHYRYVPPHDAPFDEYRAWAAGVIEDYKDGGHTIGVYLST